MTTSLVRSGSTRALRARLTTKSLLPTLLDMPDLPRKIAALEAPALLRLVETLGLEDSGEIVALASTSQLVALFDEDLWKNEEPGEEEHFDAERFVTWLTVLQEAGEAFAAARVAELSPDFVTLAFNELLLVLNVDVMVEELDGGGEEVDRIEKALSNCAYEELDEFQLIARRADGWDAVWSLVLALDRDHRAFLRQVLERCCDLSHSYVEENGGLYDVLSDEEMLENDARAEREDRRATQGYVAPSDAKSFLSLAGSEAEVGKERDAVTRAYFRELAPNVAAAKARNGGGARIERLLAAVERASEDVAHTKRLPAPGSAKELPFRRALRELEGGVAAARREELAYLANVLIAGASLSGRRFRPVEALEAAIAVSNLGLELSRTNASDDPAALIEAVPLDVLFRRGYSALQREVVQPARAKRTLPTLSEAVPRLPNAPGFISTSEELAEARGLVSGEAAKKKRAQRSARVNGSSQ
jgi:hypothetical protein